MSIYSVICSTWRQNSLNQISPWMVMALHPIRVKIPAGAQPFRGIFSIWLKNKHHWTQSKRISVILKTHRNRKYSQETRRLLQQHENKEFISIHVPGTSNSLFTWSSGDDTSGRDELVNSVLDLNLPAVPQPTKPQASAFVRWATHPPNYRWGNITRDHCVRWSRVGWPRFIEVRPLASASKVRAYNSCRLRTGWLLWDSLQNDGFADRWKVVLAVDSLWGSLSYVRMIHPGVYVGEYCGGEPSVDESRWLRKGLNSLGQINLEIWPTARVASKWTIRREDISCEHMLSCFLTRETFFEERNGTEEARSSQLFFLRQSLSLFFLISATYNTYCL
jgi:hypothetical protein